MEKLSVRKKIIMKCAKKQIENWQTYDKKGSIIKTRVNN